MDYIHITEDKVMFIIFGNFIRRIKIFFQAEGWLFFHFQDLLYKRYQRYIIKTKIFSICNSNNYNQIVYPILSFSYVFIVTK